MNGGGVTTRTRIEVLTIRTTTEVTALQTQTAQPVRGPASWMIEVLALDDAEAHRPSVPELDRLGHKATGE